MNKSFPFQFDIYGHIASCDEDKHIRDMLEQILFTMPGERINRPDFGCGISLMVFGSTTPEFINVKKTQIHSQIQQLLGHLIKVNNLEISVEESLVNILINYTVFKNQEQSSVEFSR